MMDKYVHRLMLGKPRDIFRLFLFCVFHHDNNCYNKSLLGNVTVQRPHNVYNDLIM